MTDPGLRRAIMAAGSGRKLARLIGVSQQAVSQWRRVPPHHVIAIERHTGIQREELRPDLYPPRFISTTYSAE